MNLDRAMLDPKLFRPWFKDVATWAAWFAFIRAVFAIPMTEEELALYRQCTGRQEPPALPVTEIWLIVGRRGGKSLILALLAIYLALFKDWTGNLVPGERGTVLVLAADRRQAQSIMRYARALCEEVLMLRGKVERTTSEEIEFTNRTAIEVGTASFRSVRGRTLIAGIFDELAFFRSEDTANPDRDIVDAVLPAMASMPGAILIGASSPHARSGVLWDAYRQFYGKDDLGQLVWQASTKTMNPTIADKVIAAAYERDPAVAAAEYGAQFRTDIESFVAREVVEACVQHGRYELPPISSNRYFAFTDPSGGSADAFTLAIAHSDRNPDGTRTVILDAVREVKPPFSPDAVISDFADLLKTYCVSKVVGDRYAGEFPRELFRKKGITYELSEKVRSDIYRDVLPLLNAGRVELLDNPRIVTQFTGLERRTSRGGKDSIDHGPGGHDDLVNSVAGVVLQADKSSGPIVFSDAALAAMGITPMHLELERAAWGLPPSNDGRGW